MAELTTLQNGTSSNQNLVTGVTIQGYAATAGQRLQPRVYIAQLNGAAATLTLGIRNTTDSSWVWRGTWIKGTAADTIAEPDFPAFIANAKTYAIFVSSTNASDTANPDVTVDWFDVQKVDLDAVKGTSNNATGVGALGGDYYTTGYALANTMQIASVDTSATGSGSISFPRGTLLSTYAGGAVASVTGAVGSVTGNVGGNVTGSVGSITGVTFPTNFGGFTIHADGYAEANVVRVTGNVNSAAGLADLGATYDLENHVNAHVVLMSTDVISAASVSSAAVTKIQGSLSTLAAADIRTAVGLASANLDTQLGDVPTNSEFSARTLASADYATSTALAVVDQVADDVKTVTVKMDTMLVLDGMVYQFTQNALELAVVNVTLDSTDINAIVAGVVAGLEGTEVTYTGPVLDDGTLTLIEGDDYTDRPFVWTITGYTGPSLNGAAAVLRFVPMAEYNLAGSDADAECEISFTLTQSGTTVTVSVEPTALQLSVLTKTHPPLPSPNYKAHVRATASSVTLVLADATRRRLIGAITS